MQNQESTIEKKSSLPPLRSTTLHSVPKPLEIKNETKKENSENLSNDENDDEMNSIQNSVSKSKFQSSQGLSKSKITQNQKRPLWKKKIVKFLDSAPVLIFMSILTIYALFAADVQAAWLRVNIDYGFNVIQCILIGIFTLEWVLNIIAKIDYIWSFFFWLDLVATISLLQDLDWVINPLMGYGSARQRSFKSSVQAAKAMSKVSSASRATRVLRVIRIVRLIRMVKLYKSVITARENKEKLKKNQDLEHRTKIEKNLGSNDTTLTRRDYIIGKGSIGPNGGSIIEQKDSVSEGVINEGNNGNGIRNHNNDHNNNKSNVNHNDKNNNDNKKNNDNINSDPTERDQKFSSKGTEGDALLPQKENNNLKKIDENKKEDDEKNDKIIDEKNIDNKEDMVANQIEESIDDMDEEDLEKVVKESRISKLISDSLTKKVIILILILLVVFPILSDDFFASNSGVTYELIAQLISASYDLFESQNKILDRNVLYGLFDTKFPALNISYNGTVLYSTNDTKYNDSHYFRYKEVTTVFSSDGQVNIVYSLLKETQLTGLLNIFQTIFVCIMLTGAAILFEHDARQLVLGPLEIMIEIVDNVAKDPINAKNVEDLQTGVKALLNENEEGKNKNNENKNEEEENYEVSVIKAAIIKISALLAISFGEAGGEIIKKNITSGQDLNPRLKGKKKTAIFGFCDIRQFEDLNLALEEKTILLINEIADIVHSSVDK